MTSYVQKGFKIYLVLSCLSVMMPIFGVRLRNYVTLFSYIVYVEYIINHRHEIVQKVLVLNLIFSFYRYYWNDVTDWVGKDAESGKYYFYERYHPYYSILDKPNENALHRRQLIYYHSINHE